MPAGLLPGSPSFFVRVAIAAALLALALGYVLRGESAEASVRRVPRVAEVDLVDRDAVRGRYPSVPVVKDGILAFPPAAAEDGAVVYLHGIHGRPKNGCPFLRAGASEIGWLLCPEANVREPAGTFSWGGSAVEKRAVVARAERAAGGDGDVILVGFSQGAYVALELIAARLGRYRGLVLLGADVTPDARALSASGVRRVVLASGALEPWSATLPREAERLRSAGIDARYVSLGHVGHTYDADDPETMREAIRWAAGRPARIGEDAGDAAPTSP